MNVLVEILKYGTLILKLEPIALEAAQKLKALFTTLDPSVEVNIKNLSGEAIAADDQLLQLVADWKKAHGLA